MLIENQGSNSCFLKPYLETFNYITLSNQITLCACLSIGRIQTIDSHNKHFLGKMILFSLSTWSVIQEYIKSLFKIRLMSSWDDVWVKLLHFPYV